MFHCWKERCVAVWEGGCEGLSQVLRDSNHNMSQDAASRPGDPRYLAAMLAIGIPGRAAVRAAALDLPLEAAVLQGLRLEDESRDHKDRATIEDGNLVSNYLPTHAFSSDAERELGWTAFLDGTGILPDYREAASKILASPALMAGSTLSSTISALESLSKAHKRQESWDELVERITGRAFGPTFDGTAFISELDVQGNCLAMCWEFFASFNIYDRQILCAAIRELLRTEDPDGMRTVLGLMMRAARECTARKKQVLATLLKRVKLHTGNDEVSAQETAANSEPKINEKVALAKLRVYLACEELIEELKDAALASTFLEPTKAYYRAVGDTILEGDTDIHGSNTYLALLAATLGIRCSRPAYLEDGCQGIIDFIKAGLIAVPTPPREPPRNNHKAVPAKNGNFLDRLFSSKDPAPPSPPLPTPPKSQPFNPNIRIDALAAIWHPQNAGKAFETVALVSTNPPFRGRLGTNARITVRTQLPTNDFFYSKPGRQMRAMDFGTAASKPDRWGRGYREKLAVYLNQYCRYFEAANLLSRLVSMATADEAVKEACDVVFEDLKRRVKDEEHDRPAAKAQVDGEQQPLGDNPSSDAARLACLERLKDCDDFRFWVWDLDESDEGGGPKLDLVAAQMLFAHAGAVKRFGADPLPVAFVNPHADEVQADDANQDFWRCPSCTFHNPNLLSQACEICESPRPVAPTHLGPFDSDPSLSTLPSHAVVKVTAAGDIRGGGTGREHVANLLLPFSGQHWSKWLHPGVVSRSWAQYDLISPLEVAAYGLCSANDAPMRDPAAWTLLGKPVNGDGWVVLHSAGSKEEPEIFDKRFGWKWFGLPNAVGRKWRALRLEITVVSRVGDGVQLSHWYVKVRN